MTIANIAQRASSLILAVLIRGLLGPGRSGIWNLVEVWRQLLASATLGVHWAADRDMPMLRAQGRQAEEDLMRWVTFTYLFAEAVAIAVGFWGYWLIARQGWSADLALGLGLVPLLATLTTAYSAFETFAKNRKAFRLWAYISVGQIAIDWAMLGAVVLAGLRGLLFGLLAGWTARVAGVWLLNRRVRMFSLRLVFRGRLVRTMLAFGIPVAIWNLGFSLTQRLDSLAVGTVLGTTALGLYYLGPQIATSLAAVATALSVVSYPNLMERFGSEDPAAVERHVRQYVRAAVLIATPLIAAVGLYGISVIVTEFLPSFERGLPAMKVYMLTLIFTQSGMFSIQVALAHKRVRVLMLTTFVALMAQLAVLGVGTLSGLTITWAAWSGVASQGTFALLALARATRMLGVDRREALGFWARIPVAWLGFAALLILIDRLAPPAHGLAGSLLVAAGELSVFAVAASALVYAIDRGAFTATRALLRSQG
jgi:O-antigen/teichoic acid export membrane protein